MNREQYNRILHLCEVLESGKYEKGKFTLREGDKYCCLGVACDISGLGEWVGTNPEGRFKYSLNDGFYSKIRLPKGVREYYGFPTNSGFIETCGECRVGLDTYNDGPRLLNGMQIMQIEERTHPEIAGIIRKWLATQEVENG